MLKYTCGTFNGTGADLYICCGFIPDKIKVFNFETSNDYWLDWNKGMARSGEFVDGCQVHTGTTYRQITALTTGNGIKRYRGGTVLSSTEQTSTTYAEGVYLKRDIKDYRYGTNKMPDGGSGDAVSSTIDTWTLDTSGSCTGHFNEDVTGTYIGEGSTIIIDGVEYSIVALTASQGEGDDEVTLDRDAKSAGTYGNVEFIGGMYDYAPIALGEVTLDGFLLSNSTLNANNALCWFEAFKYD